MKTFITTDDVCIKSSNRKSKILKSIMIALIPIILFAFFKNGVLPFLKGDNNIFEMLYPLIFIIVGGLTSIFIEFVYFYFILKKKRYKKYLKNIEIILPGILLSLILPIKIPIYLLVLGVVVGTIIEKLLLKSFKRNIFTPTLIGYLFLFIIFNNSFLSVNYFNNYEAINLINETPLVNLSNLDFVGSYNEVVLPYGSLWDLFFGFKPGSYGEISILICLLSFLYLVYTKAIKYKIPIIYIGTVFIMTFLIGLFNNMDIWYSVFSILSGSLFFAAIFIASDSKTSPVTNVGQIIYALGLGIITVLLRYLTPFDNGFFIAILVMNLFVYILDRHGAICSLNRLKTLITSIICIIVLMISTYYCLINLKPVETISTDSNFNIISKLNSNNFVYYIVTEKCHHNLKSKITINPDGKIIDILILENSEPQYDIIEEENYINKLIKYQDNLNNLEDIKIALKTTSGLKKMVENVVIDYKTNEM